MLAHNVRRHQSQTFYVVNGRLQVSLYITITTSLIGILYLQNILKVKKYEIKVRSH